MKKITFRSILREFSSFLLFLIMVSFVVSCCMILFLDVLSIEMDLIYTSKNIAKAAKITFINVLIITVLLKIADHIRRRIMVDKPVKRITRATESIMKGDFSVRIETSNTSGMEGFDQISEAINSMAYSAQSANIP